MSGNNSLEDVIADHTEHDQSPVQVETLCPNCFELGTTTIMYTKIPFFREIRVSHFNCPYCRYTDKSVKYAGKYPDKGVHFHLHVKTADDLNRRVVKSSAGSIQIQPINLEVPGQTQENAITTVEGILSRAYLDLQTVVQTVAIQNFLRHLDELRTGKCEFEFILDDPSGNSFIENPLAPQKDPRLDFYFYDKKTGGFDSADDEKTDSFYVDDESSKYVESILESCENLSGYLVTCPACFKKSEVKLCALSTPGFKDVSIHAFHCDECGYDNREVAIKGKLSPLCRVISIDCDSEKDLEREVIKSESASLQIPQIKLEILPGSIGGKITSLRGLLEEVKKKILRKSPYPDDHEDMKSIALDSLDKYMNNELSFTLIIRDPLGNSYVQKIGENDKIIVEDVPRTDKENEEFGCVDDESS